MTSNLTKKICFSALLTFLVLPFFTWAQTTEDPNALVNGQLDKLQKVYDSISHETMTINLTPANPKVGETVTASLTTPGIDLDQANITWYFNNKKQSSDFGLKKITFTSPQKGVTLDVRAEAIAPDGQTGTGTLTLKPSEIVLIWEAVSYTPPFYRGKALAPRGGIIRVTAITDMTDKNGKRVSSNNLVYKWYKNDTLNSQYSGYGKNAFYTEDATFTRDGNEIKAQVYTTDNSSFSESKTTINHNDPKILFYQESPLLGRLYNQPITSLKINGQDETIVITEPYFFSANKNSNRLEYSWSINGKSVKIFGPTVKIGNSNNSSSQSTVSLSMKHLDKLLQGADSSFIISSSASNSNNNGVSTTF